MATRPVDRTVQYQCWIASHRGLVRRNNEDACVATNSGDEFQPADWNGLVPSRGGWVLLADGMGGHRAGEVASRLAVACLSTLSELLTTDEGICAAVLATNEAIFGAMSDDQMLEGMGTTIAAAVIQNDTVMTFNVGDSRIYHLAESLWQVSEDHVIQGHVLTQCLGGMHVDEAPSPHIRAVELKRGERLLMCSDGLTDLIADDDIERLLRDQSASPAQSLVQAALLAGGTDNVTVAVLERTQQ